MNAQRVKDLVRHRAPRLAAVSKKVLRRAPTTSPEPLAYLDGAWNLCDQLGPGIRVSIDADGVWLIEASGVAWRHIRGVPGPFLGLERGDGFERVETDFLREVLQPGAVLVDVGANIGTFSVRIAREIDDLQVIAFEPAERTYEALVANIRRNRVTQNVTAVPVALGGEQGKVLITADLNAANHVIPIARRPVTANEDIVQQTTLDDYMQRNDPGRLDVLKLDVEGLELRVLEGATTTLRRFRPVILCEIEARWTERYGYHYSEIFEALSEMSYSYRRVTAEGIVQASGSIDNDIRAGNNFIFVPA